MAWQWRLASMKAQLAISGVWQWAIGVESSLNGGGSAWRICDENQWRNGVINGEMLAAEMARHSAAYPRSPAGESHAK